MGFTGFHQRLKGMENKLRYMIFVDDKGRNYIAFIDRKQEQIKKERGEVVVDLLEPDNCPNE